MDEVDAVNSATATHNAATSGSEFIAIGMSVRRRRRKKRDVADELQDAMGSTVNGSPPIPFSPPYDESFRNKVPASSTSILKRQDSACGSEYEPTSSWDTTSGNSNTLSVMGNSGNSEASQSASRNTNNSAAGKHASKPDTSEAQITNQSSLQSKQNSSSTTQRSMIDCQKMRFARNLAEFQGGLHKCGISVKDHIDIYRRFKQLAVTVPIESDSFTDNPAASKSQKPQRRHKRRMKKMAIDISPIDAAELEVATVAHEVGRRKNSTSKGSLEAFIDPELETDRLNGTLTRSKTASDSIRKSDLELNLPVAGTRKSPWKNIPFKFSSSDYNFSTSALTNHDDSSNQTMEFDGQSSNTLEGPQSGTLNNSCISNPLIMSDIDAHNLSETKFLESPPSPIKALSEGERDTSSHTVYVTSKATETDLIEGKDEVFGTSDSNEGSLDTSSPSQDEGVAGILTADEGREGDDELSENDDARSVCGMPCAIPWWEEGEMTEATHRPEFDSKFNQILEGIKSVTSSDSVNAFLQSSATLFHPGVCKRTLPTAIEADSRDNSSESYEHLTSPDGSSKSKRSRYSVVGTTSTRQRYAKFHHSGKHKKKRRRSYSGEVKTRHSGIRSANFRERSQPIERVPESSIGHKMLLNMGWNPGNGLGNMGTGIAEPVVLKSQTNKKGFGFVAAK